MRPVLIPDHFSQISSLCVKTAQGPCQTARVNFDRPVVAAFDLDGTLTEGGSVGRWLRAIGGSRRFYGSGLSLAVPLGIGAVMSGSAADSAKESLFRKILAGQSFDEVSARSREFALAHLHDELRPHIKERLDWHKASGHHIVVVSASPELYVSVIAQELGAHGAVGTRLAVDPLGRLTGGYLGRNCRGEEKIRRLREWIDERGFEHTPVIYAYGNSRGDLRILSAADHPFDVGQLGRLGALRHFPRLSSGEHQG